MKKLMFLFIGLALYALPGFAYTYHDILFEESQELGSENTYYSYIPVTPTTVSISVDAWNSEYNDYAWDFKDEIFAQVRSYRNGIMQHSMSNIGEPIYEHTYHDTWTNVQQWDEFRITLINLNTDGPGQCWARIDYYW
jgi:hypothetical protein